MTKIILVLTFLTFSAFSQEIPMFVDDVVLKIEPTEGGHRVLFRTHAAVYHLKSNSKKYIQVLHGLNSSKDSQRSVKVQVDSNSMEIKEVVTADK